MIPFPLPVVSADAAAMPHPLSASALTSALTSAASCGLPVLGPGSQEDGAEAMDFPTLPSEMLTFAPPRLEREIAPAQRAAAVALLEEFLAALQHWQQGWQQRGSEPPALDLLPLSADALALLDDALGEGEVSARVDLDCEHRVRETAFPGIWRVLGVEADGQRRLDVLEAGELPRVLHSAGRLPGPPAEPPPLDRPGLMNAPAIYHEILAAMQEGAEHHVVNLSLLPMSPEDLVWLDQAVGRGPVHIHSRGYGNCHIGRTALPRVWWVQYFNGNGGLILNTLEVTDLPPVVAAGIDDCFDSIERLAEWIDELRRED